MKCPYCNNKITRVVDKRDNFDTKETRRRRECQSCKKRFTTYERVEILDFIVIKKDGTTEQFNREKIKSGISKAMKKDVSTENEIDLIVDEIEKKLFSRKSNKVSSIAIGKMVLNSLKKVDQLAYLRYASIYKDFNSVEEFKNEIDNLENINNNG